MRIITFALILSCAPALHGAPEDVTGTWSTTMVEPDSGSRPAVVYQPTFELNFDGTALTGFARLSNWPGDAPITDGKVEGDRVTFTLVHKMPYSTSGGTFYPSFRCVGTIKGNQMELTMFHAPFDGSGVESVKWEMKGAKVVR